MRFIYYELEKNPILKGYQLAMMENDQVVINFEFWFSL